MRLEYVHSAPIMLLGRKAQTVPTTDKDVEIAMMM
jgi:hypothetical protein